STFSPCTYHLPLYNILLRRFSVKYVDTGCNDLEHLVGKHQTWVWGVGHTTCVPHTEIEFSVQGRSILYAPFVNHWQLRLSGRQAIQYKARLVYPHPCSWFDNGRHPRQRCRSKR